MLKVVTWNVNSIKMREVRATNLLTNLQPDIVCLQELKTVDEGFPGFCGPLGYHAEVFGQKTYNGVAVLSKKKPDKAFRKVSDNDEDARLIGCKWGELTVYSAYVPNGQAVGSEKYEYKLEWFERLLFRLNRMHSNDEPLLICGDFNVAPEDIDVHDPNAWKNQILCSPAERNALKKLESWGLYDCFRSLHPTTKAFSWWDYRMLAFPKDKGLRIDFILATKPLLDKCRSASILREERKGEKPSDHAPVSAEFDF